MSSSRKKTATQPPPPDSTSNKVKEPVMGLEQGAPEPTAAELQAAIAEQRAAMERQRQQLSQSAQQSLQVPLDNAVSAGRRFWDAMALGSRMDQLTAWIRKKYDDYNKQPRLIEMAKHRSNLSQVRYTPSSSLSSIASLGKTGLEIADRNYKTGVEQLSALIELVTLFSILTDAMATSAKGIRSPITVANELSLQRQFAESYFLYVYLSDRHDKAAIATITLMSELPPQIRKNQGLTRAPSVAVNTSSMFGSDPVTTLDLNTIQSLNALLNQAETVAKSHVLQVLEHDAGGQIPDSRLPKITDGARADALYKSIVEKRTAALGSLTSGDVNKVITSGPLAGIIVESYAKGSVSVSSYSADMANADRAFEEYIKQIKSGVVPQTKVVSTVPLRTAGPLGTGTTTGPLYVVLGKKRVRNNTNTNTKTITNTNTNTNTNTITNTSTIPKKSNVFEGGRRTQKHRRTKSRRAKKQTRRR